MEARFNLWPHDVRAYLASLVTAVLKTKQLWLCFALRDLGVIGAVDSAQREFVPAYAGMACKRTLEQEPKATAGDLGNSDSLMGNRETCLMVVYDVLKEDRLGDCHIFKLAHKRGLGQPNETRIGHTACCACVSVLVSNDVFNIWHSMLTDSVETSLAWARFSAFVVRPDSA